MSTIETGGPAFPMQEPQAIHDYAVAAVDGITDPDERDRAYLKARAEAVSGASMRDYFAAKAMQGLVSGHLAKYGHEYYWPRPEIASEAYEIADAMLASRKPEYAQARMASQALDDRATIAGLESAVSHMSALFDEFRALLVEVNDVCGRDGHGGQLEDGESEIIDKVRAALSMTEASAMLSARKGMS